MHIEPYVFFNGRCEEALDFYREKLGAEVPFMMRFKDSPEPEACPENAQEKIMHANVQIGKTTLMVSDGRCDGELDFRGFALSLAPATVAEAERVFNALAEGGAVQMPFGKTFWSPAFGMVNDRFGVPWMVNVAE